MIRKIKRKGSKVARDALITGMLMVIFASACIAIIFPNNCEGDRYE